MQPARMKRDQIYEKLRTNIECGVYPEGTRIPMEVELSEQFGVARDTLRAALKKLEKEGLIERFRGQGTFVRRMPDEKVLYILIPSPEYPSMLNRFQLLWENMYFSSVLRAARENAYRLDTIAFSRTNSPKDVNWDAFESFGPSTRVIVSSLWYETIFPFLAERNVRTALTRMRDFGLDSYLDYFSSWIDFYFDSMEASRNAVRRLIRCGCRKIANSGVWAYDEFNCKSIGYRQAMEEAGLTPMHVNVPDGLMNIAELRALISGLWRETRFDGLFLENRDYPFDPGLTLNQNLGLPEEVRILSFFDPEQNVLFRPQVSALEYPLSDGVYEMTNLLLKEEYTPVHKQMDMLYVNRETTGGPYVPPVRKNTFKMDF